MSQATVQIDKPRTEPAAVLAGLLALRSELGVKIASLTASRSKLQALAHVEANAGRELEAATQSDTAALTAWATAGCIGEQPTVDLQQRRVLAENLVSARASAAAATGSIQDVDFELGEVQTQSASLATLIEAAALDITEIEFHKDRADYADLMRAGGIIGARLQGYRAFLAEQGRTLVERREPQAGQKYLARAERLMLGIAIPKPDFAQHDLFAASAQWGRRVKALCKG